MSNNTLILGLQWGDEGKGKIVDALAKAFMQYADSKVVIMLATQ